MESKTFSISEQRLNLIGHDLLIMGEQHRLAPWELCITLGLLQDWMKKELGLVLKEQTEIKVDDED